MLATQSIAQRDLTGRIEPHGSDETATLLQSLRQMADSLRSVIGNVRSSAHEVSTASGQILAGTQDLSSRTEEQAASLTETAAAMEELTATVRQNADNAQQANALAVSASHIASQGGEVVSDVINTMNTINTSSKEIEDIIGVIDGIAFQTNILALNAAVESARAGEAGRGFAVVAGEVRSLAQRSAKAAGEIKALITSAVEATAAGNTLVNKTGETMTEIVEAIQRVTDIMGEITAASQEQSAGIGQINDAVSQMDQTTRQNAELVEEATAAAASLQEQASNLTQLVSTFHMHAEHGTEHHRQAPSQRLASQPKEALAAPRLASSQHKTDNNADTHTPRRLTAASDHNTPSQSSAGTRTPVAAGAYQTSPGVVEEWESF